MINGRVLIPFRHATSLNVPISRAKLDNKIPFKVSRAHGVEPAPTLFDTPGGSETASDPSVAEADAAAQREKLKVVYVAYVANADSDDVLAAWWGTPDTLEEDGTMLWSPERLDMSLATAQSADSPQGGLHSVGAGAASPGFAEGEVPPLKMNVHTETVQRPSAEPEPATSEAAEDGDE